MTFKELKIAAYLYDKFTNYDEHFIKISNKKLDLTLKNHQDLTLQFLRGWGCRQFKKSDHNYSANEFSKWFSQNRQKLPMHNQDILNLSDEDINAFEKLFDSLRKTHASTKAGIVHRVGPVGAAKLLFALRKHCFAPWDNAIISHFGYPANGKGYCSYLLQIKGKLISLKADCQKRRVVFNNICKRLKHNSTLPKLVDEYFWVSITKKCNPSEIVKLTK